MGIVGMVVFLMTLLAPTAPTAIPGRVRVATLVGLRCLPSSHTIATHTSHRHAVRHHSTLHATLHHGKLWVLLSILHHLVLSFLLRLFVARFALLSAIALLLFEALDFASMRKERWSAETEQQKLSRILRKYVPVFLHLLPFGECTFDTQRGNTYSCRVLYPRLCLLLPSLLG